MHANGAAAHGYFEVTKDVTGFTKAEFMNQVGKKTPCFLRFSTVAGSVGSSDLNRDPRGFAIKFYTEEGIYDMVGNNTPVFFIRDAIKFPDFIHSQKPNPRTGRGDPDQAWDFWVQHPESFHQTSFLFSNRGTPYGYRHLNGYSSHTYKWINARGQVFFVKYTFKTDAGIKNFTAEEAAEMHKKNPDFAKEDLFNHIESGNVASWTWFVQIIPEAEGESYKWDIYDITKVWPHSDYPLQEVGKLVLNRNPENWFAEVEQVAFTPSNLVPGIEASNDKMLQGRLFSYPDTHRHRLGRNYDLIPINHSYRSKINTYQRDGNMRVDSNGGSSANYEPNTRGGPVPDPKYKKSPVRITEHGGRFKQSHPNCDFEQVRTFYNKVLNEVERQHLINNIVSHMGNTRKEIKLKAVEIYKKIDPDFGGRVEAKLGFKTADAKL